MFQSKTAARMLCVAVTALFAAALLAPAAQAAETKEGFEQFNGCPTAAESPTSVICIRSDVTGGTLNVGSKEVPVENPLVINGGVNGGLQEFVAGPEGGLSKVKQKVPGGVIGLTGLTWLLEFFGSDALTLYAITELQGAPSNFTLQTVKIPIKVHLVNSTGLLGDNCYIGDESEFITLNLTTGTTNPPPPNEPITGVAPEFAPEPPITKFLNGTYVDNAFSAPGANGCALKLFGGLINIDLDEFVNEQAGLPAAAGTNTAIQEFDLEFTPRTNVY